MLNRKVADGALLREFIPLVLIVAVATVMQRLTHHIFHGNP